MYPFQPLLQSPHRNVWWPLGRSLFQGMSACTRSKVRVCGEEHGELCACQARVRRPAWLITWQVGRVSTSCVFFTWIYPSELPFPRIWWENDPVRLVWQCVFPVVNTLKFIPRQGFWSEGAPQKLEAWPCLGAFLKFLVQRSQCIACHLWAQGL